MTSPGAADDKYSSSRVTVTMAASALGLGRGRRSECLPEPRHPGVQLTTRTRARQRSDQVLGPGWWMLGSTFELGRRWPNPPEPSLVRSHRHANATGHATRFPRLRARLRRGPALGHLCHETMVAQRAIPTASVIDHYIVTFRPPIQDGVRNIVKQGNVIPVKLTITDCSGQPVLARPSRSGTSPATYTTTTARVTCRHRVRVGRGHDRLSCVRSIASTCTTSRPRTSTPTMPYTVVIREARRDPWPRSSRAFVIQATK